MEVAVRIGFKVQARTNTNLSQPPFDSSIVPMDFELTDNMLLHPAIVDPAFIAHVLNVCCPHRTLPTAVVSAEKGMFSVLTPTEAVQEEASR